jgi:glycosyltransferase involved in cell wall biosynthesis
VLTFNEECNIARVLRSVEWASQVVVVDSGSTDLTERIARRFSNVRWFVRSFDSHGAQWEFAIRLAASCTPYVLALDADYEVPTSFVEELALRFLDGEYSGGIAAFEYQVGCRKLLGSVYPRKLVVFRPTAVRVVQPGHTQEFLIDGPLYRFAARIVHNDRKPLDRFVASQLNYARLEQCRFAEQGVRRWQDHLRRLGIMPVIAAGVAYIKAGGPFCGSASLRYAYERALFECLLALRLLRHEDSNVPDLPDPACRFEPNRPMPLSSTARDQE